eukprot:11275439-Alexandrium_andersonii.AAC.1
MRQHQNTSGCSRHASRTPCTRASSPPAAGRPVIDGATWWRSNSPCAVFRDTLTQLYPLPLHGDELGGACECLPPALYLPAPAWQQ